ncbi:hypothetical protein HaLaN_18230 [Haematococcus lacustris]|uniref:Uncharacterized protein n=1 Tax=Haematococcus lacustris TaxID=44745 RepID=A0A699ZQJ9_HAELA|nr:hypothetical protein HaLaN_18230 [Haematococcus lacustris]
MCGANGGGDGHRVRPPQHGVAAIQSASSDLQRKPLESLLAYCHMCPRTNHSGEKGLLGTMCSLPPNTPFGSAQTKENGHKMFVLDPLAHLLELTAR